MACNRSVFITGLTVYGPVPNSCGIQGFNFHLKIYKNSDPQNYQYNNFSVLQKAANFQTLFFTEPIFLNADLSEVLKVEFCDRTSAELYSQISELDIGLTSLEKEALMVED